MTDGAVFHIAGESAIASRRVSLGQLPVLSRLISLLSRIPAVKWAFSRLRPVPHGGSVAAVPIAADDPPAIVAETASSDVSVEAEPPASEEAVAANDAAIPAVAEVLSAAPVEVCVADEAPAAAETASSDVSVEAEPPASEAVAANDAAIPAVAEVLSAAPIELCVADEAPAETATEVEPVVVEEAAVSPIDIVAEPTVIPELIIDNDAEVSAEVEASNTEQATVASIDVESEPVDIAPVIISSDPIAGFPSEAEPVVAEETTVSSADVAITPVDVIDLTGGDAHSPGIPEDAEPVAIEEACVALAANDVSDEDVAAGDIDKAPSASATIEIEPAPANEPEPVVEAVVAETSPTIVTEIAPEPVTASPAPAVRSAPKVRARPAEPADRAALIRQRWAETGIRMWNPRLHGTGDATLNIQGSIGLLPPADGETMPRYDKLEFRMLGGQIVCEGVIVEAPAQAAHRSFTRLAEPRAPDRAREPTRERQAALA
ncbi:hypothetical protein [Bradyrhizobium stylosanthis]|uniref:hypothetical protein n=1 Tax=Bradyrhizobium stylosanthis TaxID=1803665 RepID=UPI001FDA4880|nr:hypothetical protein [Bradyrhizobium stylosanthis]